MKYVFILAAIFLTFGLLFTASSGVLQGQALAYQQEERYNYYYPDEYLQGYVEDSFYGLDKKFLEEIDEGLLLNTALSLLKGLNLSAEAYSDYDTVRNYQDNNMFEYGEKSLPAIDKGFLNGVDTEVLLDTALNLLEGLELLGIFIILLVILREFGIPIFAPL